MKENVKKLVKLQTKAQECLSRKKAVKILKKVTKHESNRRLPTPGNFQDSTTVLPQ